jgi:hypothetical protein
VKVSDVGRLYARDLVKARFCLVVPGGLRGAAGVAEAVLHGCVPVVVQRSKSCES